MGIGRVSYARKRIALTSCRGSSTEGRSNTRTPVRLLPMPRRMFLRGRSAAEKKAAISLASASEARTSLADTTSGGSVCRAAFTSFGLPLFTTTAAASSDEPILSPTSCLCLPSERGVAVFFCFGALFGASFFVAVACVGAVSSGVAAADSAFVVGWRLKERSFFRKSVRLTVRLLRLGGRGGPRGGVHRYG